MAVATARRLRVDRIAKDRILQTFGQQQVDLVRKMSFRGSPPRRPSADERLPLASPILVEDVQVPQGASLRESSLKKRKASKAKVPSDLRRSASTPHIRGVALTDSGPLSPTSEKRRNKLGYHRTSVACGE
jgi:hypothetical protein